MPDTDPISPEQESTETPQEQAPMLDVHPPQHAAHSWRDFFIHIATIVIGLCIAVGIEQIVEFFHHRHQVHQMEEALREEGLENRAVIQHDLQRIDQAIAGASADIVTLQANPSQKPSPALKPEPADLFAPGNDAWLTIRDSGLLSIVPRLLVENYWKVYYTQQLVVSDIDGVRSDNNRLSALISLHSSPSELSPADRDTLLVAYANHRQSLKHLRTTLTYLDVATELALANQKIGMENTIQNQKSRSDN
jgi:hypothetical protein